MSGKRNAICPDIAALAGARFASGHQASNLRASWNLFACIAFELGFRWARGVLRLPGYISVAANAGREDAASYPGILTTGIAKIAFSIGIIT
jgi:hypothetical protein